jgi:putative transposase
MDSGNGFIQHFASKCARRWGAKLSRVRALLIERRVKTIGLRGPRGYDAGKKVKGRKRHLLVDTQGLILKAKVHSADIIDREGVMLFMEGAAEQVPRLRHIWLDAGYNGKGFCQN